MPKLTLTACLSLSVAMIILSTNVRADHFLRFSNTDFGVSDDFSDLDTFDFDFRLQGELASGAFSDPAIVIWDYDVNGDLVPGTPSNFTGFLLKRPESGVLPGADFYAQGSSLTYEIAAGANLADGVQVSELVGTTDVFVLNAVEVGTGRYHPPIIRLNSDGTGSIENSNNNGGINPMTMEEVNVTPGQEYSSTLTFNPSTLTLFVVPEPGSLGIIALGLGAVAFRRRRTPMESSSK